jgi:predicted Fe-S protein YdhL (DUF1289 family)
MASIKGDLRQVVGRLKTAQAQLNKVLKDTSWVEEARKYAERQGQEVRKLLNTDLSKVKVFLEKERKGLEDLKNQIPGEVKKWKKYVDVQRKEVERMLTQLRKTGKLQAKSRSRSTGKASKAKAPRQPKKPAPETQTTASGGAS